MTGAAIALSAFLLFLIEPLTTKELLPVMGGSSAVWLGCLCFFQVMLLAGYLYAALLVAKLRGSRGRRVHASLLLLAAVWAVAGAGRAMARGVKPDRSPLLSLALALLLHIGLPFLLLSATSPLLQVWEAEEQGQAVRFNLFALSNVASLLALVLYPAVFEPLISLHVQRWMWAAGFNVFALLCGGLVLRSRSSVRAGEGVPTQPEEMTAAGQSAGSLGLCFLLSAAAAAQLYAVTGHLTENLAALPLLWVVPLALYLASFALAFDAPHFYRRPIVVRLLVVMLASLGYLLSKTDVSLPLGLGLLFFLFEMFIACWFCQAEVYRLRPLRSRNAARFYLVLAAGGATGTTCFAVLMPMLFRANYDLPLAFALTAAAGAAVLWLDGWSSRLLWVTATVLCLLLTLRLGTAYARETIFMGRNFYGSLRVKQREVPEQAGTSRLLLHGTIEHGMQWFAPTFRSEPLTYYGRNSGVGVALAGCCGSHGRSVGVVGLGAGTLAAYGEPGDTFRFYEINPTVEDIARSLFTYLRDSKAAISVVQGDARQSLQAEPSSRFDVLVIDAFSGDAIPVHLLSVEAVRLYRRHLAAGGVMAFHISNQYINLEPALASLAAEEGLRGRVIDSAADASHGLFAARWVLLGGPGCKLLEDDSELAGAPLEPTTLRVWTDDYSSLLPLLRWTGDRR